MDPTEAHVFKHLEQRGFESVRYEPDGNVPPDFVIDGLTAGDAAGDAKAAIRVALLCGKAEQSTVCMNLAVARMP